MRKTEFSKAYSVGKRWANASDVADLPTRQQCSDMIAHFELVEPYGAEHGRWVGINEVIRRG